jgi:nucleolar complex protein 2
MLKSLIKVLISLWSESTDLARMVAFMSLRKLAVVQSTKFLNTVLKRMYLSFVANSKFTSPKSRPLIVLMENCLIEMYNLDHHTTYQHGFVYIRQLAVHLRTAMVQQKKVLIACIFLSEPMVV